MDFELLNSWVHYLHFDIRHEKVEDNPRLYMSLKAHANDYLYSYVLLLSESKNDILDFLGFNTSIEYDKLTEKNVFEYLCTSSRLKPQFIQYNSFKGPHAKNKHHDAFDKYLVKKDFQKSGCDRSKECRIFSQDAINYFQKEKEYTSYKENRKLLDIVNEKQSLIKSHYSDTTRFNRFIAVHGILKIVSMNNDEFLAAWSEFSTQNWSGLLALGI